MQIWQPCKFESPCKFVARAKLTLSANLSLCNFVPSCKFVFVQKRLRANLSLLAILSSCNFDPAPCYVSLSRLKSKNSSEALTKLLNTLKENFFKLHYKSYYKFSLCIIYTLMINFICKFLQILPLLVLNYLQMVGHGP